MIRHIVLWKLSAAEEAAKRADTATLVAALSTLPALIPQIKALSVGPDVAHASGRWELALVVDFASVGDLEIYQAHPEHLQVVQIVKPRVSERAVIDFEVAAHSADR
jgi:hypothetical protein